MSNDNTAKAKPANPNNQTGQGGGQRRGGGAGPAGPGGPLYPGAGGMGPGPGARRRQGMGQGMGQGGGQGMGPGMGQGQGQPQNPAQAQAQAQAQARQRANQREGQFLFQAAQQAMRQNNQQEATAKLRECLQVAPNHIGAMRMLAQIRLQAGDQQTASQLVARALRVDPNNDEVLTDVAMFLESTGRTRRAEQNFSKAVRLNPRNLRAQMGMGRMARRNGNIHMAEYHFRQAFYMNPRAPGVASTLGNLLSNMGRKEEAERMFRISMALFPNDMNTLLAWAKMEESRNDLERAERLVNIVKEKQPDSPGIGMSEALLATRNKDFEAALTNMDKVQVDRLRPGMQASYWYERGSVLDKMGRYDDAFEAYTKANHVNREKIGMRYRGDRNQELARRLKEVFTKDNAAKLPRATPQENDPVPIFICGFTRSGTSLVEQTLGSHPDIAPGDETFFIPELTHRAAQLIGVRGEYPEVLNELTKPGNQQHINRFRQQYLQRIRMASILEPGAHRFTDKMPMNEMHMGLINLAFPDAHILHMVRHPLDTVLASFFIDARHGDMCTYDLETAARHYALLADMARYYRENIPEIKYLRVRYEDVVADHKGETAKMLEFLGEPWDDACVEYYKSKRQPRTPSYAQVKEKIYTDSTYRYKNYRKHVDRILPILEPVIKEFGYKVED